MAQYKCEKCGSTQDGINMTGKLCKNCYKELKRKEEERKKKKVNKKQKEKRRREKERAKKINKTKEEVKSIFYIIIFVFGIAYTALVLSGQKDVLIFLGIIGAIYFISKIF